MHVASGTEVYGSLVIDFLTLHVCVISFFSVPSKLKFVMHDLVSIVITSEMAASMYRFKGTTLKVNSKIFI